MSTYEPGTVAVAVIATETVRVVARNDGVWEVFGHSFFKSMAQDNDVYISHVRPLVVLDLASMYDGLDVGGWDYVVRALRDQSSKAVITRDDIADQIEAQTKPPRIPEPGLWGVVEASRQYPDGKGFGPTKWVRTTRAGLMWFAPQFDVHAFWSDLINPTLIREGINA